MRRGQSTLEYILIVGIVAAGLIAMIFYVSRGHQGYLRSQADQLSLGQYEPGRTRIDNREHKTLLSSVNSSSTTTTTHSANPVGQRNPALEGPADDPKIQGLYAKIAKLQAAIYDLYFEWEEKIYTESIGPDSGVSGQAAKVKKGLWPWTQPLGAGSIYEQETLYIDDALCSLDYSGSSCPYDPACDDTDGDCTSLAYQLDQALAAWPARTKDTSASSSSTGETGTIDTGRHINESLGAL